MALDQTEVIDWMGIEKGTGRILLTIVDEQSWDDPQTHLLLLQEKLNRYLAFLESGEVLEALSQQLSEDVDGDRPAAIQVLAKFPPNDAGLRFLAHVTEVVDGAGYELTHKVLSE